MDEATGRTGWKIPYEPPLAEKFSANAKHPRKDVWLVDDPLNQAVSLVRETLILALLVSAPMLLIGLAVGIFVSLMQAVTQIQEQTLTFIPKIVAMVTAAILLMPWMSHRLIEFAGDIFSNSLLR